MFDGIIFDLDGTLWDATDMVAVAWEKVINEKTGLGIKISGDDLKRLFGRPLPVIIEALLPEFTKQQQEEVLEVCTQAEYDELRINPGKLYDGLVDTLKVLSKKYKLFIVSNCQDGYIELFFEVTGLDKYFTDYECPGKSGLLKAANNRLIVERNALKNPVYVGDTMGDKEASDEAGIPFIFASYGYGEVDNYYAKIESIDELQKILM